MGMKKPLVLKGSQIESTQNDKILEKSFCANVLPEQSNALTYTQLFAGKQT